MMNETLHLLEGFSYSSFIIPHSAFALILHIPHSAFAFIINPSFLILALVGGSFVVVCIVVAAWLHHRKSAGGALELEGRVARVLEPLEPEGAVLVGGELWRARAHGGERIACGRVRIVGARGHWLEVEPE